MKLNNLINSRRYYYFIGLYLVFTFSHAIIGFGNLPGGLKIFTNKKVSMEPLISNHSLTVVQPFKYYDVGDIISYYRQVDGQETIVTHRITQIGGNVYVTKGDYNQAIDSQVVVPRLVIGKVILIIPYLGLIFSTVKQPLGVALFILLPAAIVLALETYRLISFGVFSQREK
jgi:signal peptidase I